MIAQASSGYLTGAYWWTNGTVVNSYASAKTWMMDNPTPTGTFQSQLLNYTGLGSSLVQSWLTTDTSTYVGSNDNFEDGLSEFSGYITIPNNNTILQTASNSASYVSIDGDNWICNDGGSSNTPKITIPTAGTYPIFISYYANGGGTGTASYQLSWNTAGQMNGTFSAIPQSALKPLNPSWIFNGSAVPYENGVELVDGGTNEAGSAWLSKPQIVTSFHCSFDFQFVNPNANGFTLCLQGNTTSALGSSGTGLGYQGINNSAALKFDLYSNRNTTGFYVDGQSPASSGSALSPVALTSGDLMHCAIAYVGSVATIVTTDLVTGSSSTTSASGPISSVVGGNTACIGFTGSTGSGTNVCRIYITNFNFGV